MVVLENFKKSFGWADSVTMKVADFITTTGIPEFGPRKFVYTLHIDHDRIEWNGIAFEPDGNGNPAPGKNAILRTIITGREFVSVTGHIGFSPLGASITSELKGVKEDLLDVADHGGPLFGKIYGANHKGVADLLSESNDIRLRYKQEDINGINCYVLEGTTKYGKVVVWSAPDKGYSALKWKIEKTGDDIINDKPMSKTEMILWISQFECKEIQEINGYFIPKTATYDFTSTLKDSSISSSHNTYTISDVHLNPDFNTIGAFKIDLPEGTRITVPESPGIRHIWKNGKVVADVNGSTFDEIDKTIDGMKQQQ